VGKTLQQEELVELVNKLADEFLDLDLTDATPQTSLRSLGMDSYDQLEFATLLEEHLDVCIPDSKLKDLETVGGLIALLTELQADAG
jgi:acyl carrier protein